MRVSGEMRTTGTGLSERLQWRGLGVAISFLTRLPWAGQREVAPDDLTRSSRFYGWVGAGIGLWIGACYLLLHLVFAPLLAATVATGAGILATGAMHEDALGDVADGFGGGTTKERKLEIMKDSRQGSYGVLAMVLSLLLRIQALAWLPPAWVLPGLVAVHGLSRTGMVWMLWRIPSARPGGMAASLGGISAVDVAWATAGGLILAALALGAGAAVPVVATILAVLVVSWLSLRHIGGVTGDVLGSAQQVAELLGLLALVAVLRNPVLVSALTPPWLGSLALGALRW